MPNDAFNADFIISNLVLIRSEGETLDPTLGCGTLSGLVDT